ncbi:hypothetical protein FOZ63_015155, partial [Perkinsus olseni]
PRRVLQASQLTVNLDKTVHLDFGTSPSFRTGVYPLKKVGGGQGEDYIIDFSGASESLADWYERMRQLGLPPVDGDFKTLRFTSSNTFTTLVEGRTATHERVSLNNSVIPPNVYYYTSESLDIRYEIHGNSEPSDINSVDMSVRCKTVCHARPFTARFRISRSPVRGVSDVTEDSVHEVEQLKGRLRRVCWIPTKPNDFLKVGSIFDEVAALDLRGEEIYLTAF